MVNYDVRKDVIIFRAEKWLAKVTTAVSTQVKNERPLNAGWNWLERASNQVGVSSVKAILYVSCLFPLNRIKLIWTKGRFDTAIVACEYHSRFDPAIDLIN